MSHIFHKNLAAGLPVTKILIEYNSNGSEENEEERKPIYIKFTKQNSDPEMMKMLLTLDDRKWQKTGKILLWLT